MRLALFPLKNVVYPGEHLPLHIFEERYKQLMTDCKLTQKSFGIPVFINRRLGYGTQMQLLEIVKKHDSGAMDVICKGLRVFRVLDFDPQEEGRLYAAGEVEFREDVDDATAEQKENLFHLIGDLYYQLDIPPPQIDMHTFRSYTLAHKMGLSLQQEYQLLKILSEKKRLEYLISHLRASIPIVQEMNRTRETIEFNGHFRNFDPLDFEEFKYKDE